MDLLSLESALALRIPTPAGTSCGARVFSLNPHTASIKVVYRSSTFGARGDDVGAIVPGAESKAMVGDGGIVGGKPSGELLVDEAEIGEEQSFVIINKLSML